MKLDKISISGFKSIKELELPLRPLNILIGANGAGKSNFIKVFTLLSRIVEKRLQLFVGQEGGAETLLHFGQKKTNSLIIGLKFSDIRLEKYCCYLVPTKADSLVFSNELVVFDGDHYEGESLNNPQETFFHPNEIVKPGPEEQTKLLNDTLKNWVVYHFHDTSSTAKIKLKRDIDDNISLRPDGSNLAAYLYFLKKKHYFSYQNIVDTIHLVAPFFEDFSLKPDRLNTDKIKLEWRHVGSDAYFNADALSDGTLRFICLATLLLQPKLPSLILLDEPELGLHPYAITLLAEMLQSAATKTQVIVSTQSVTLVNQFQPEDIIVVEREKEESRFRRLNKKDYKDWLNDYSLGELWEKNVLGGRP